jgi:hypothetical protein
MKTTKFHLCCLLLVIFPPIQCIKAGILTIPLEDKAPPSILDAFFTMNHDQNPTKLTFYAKVQDLGSGVAEVILYYYFRPSDDLNQAGDHLDWVDVPMTVQMTNDTDQVILYKATVDFPPVYSDYCIIYRISTEDKAGNIDPAAFDIRDYPQRIIDQRIIFTPRGLPEGVLLIAGLAVFASFIWSILYVKFLNKRPIRVVVKKNSFN